MQITPIQIKAISPPKSDELFSILDQYLPQLSEGSIVAITSKVVSICEGSFIKVESVASEADLVVQEADYYLPAEVSKYAITITIKNGVLIPTAGIDESNGNGYYILWPKNPQDSANQIRAYISKKFHIKNVGVIITDSKTTPLRWGTTGMAIGYSGFEALQTYIGKPDIFGRNLKVTKANKLDGLSAAAVLIMGEGDERTPIAIIQDIPFIKFTNRGTSQKEYNNLQISIKEDLYAPILQSVEWKKGEKSNH